MPDKATGRAYQGSRETTRSGRMPDDQQEPGEAGAAEGMETMPEPHREDRRPAGEQLLRRSGPYNVADTVRRLTEAARAEGVTVFAVIDHARGARAAGMNMPATQVVVLGNPAVGTPAMLTAPDIALALPTRLLVRAADSGTEVVFTDPVALAGRYGLPPEQAVGLAGITGLVDTVLG